MSLQEAKPGSDVYKQATQLCEFCRLLSTKVKSSSAICKPTPIRSLMKPSVKKPRSVIASLSLIKVVK